MLYIIHLSHPRQIAPTTDILHRHTSHHPTFIISNIQTPPPPPARNHPKPPHRCPVCQFYSTLQHAEDTKARPLYPPSCQRDKIINWTCHIEPKLQELSVVFLRTINIHPTLLLLYTIYFATPSSEFRLLMVRGMLLLPFYHHLRTRTEQEAILGAVTSPSFDDPSLNRILCAN